MLKSNKARRDQINERIIELNNKVKSQKATASDFNTQKTENDAKAKEDYKTRYHIIQATLEKSTGIYNANKQFNNQGVGEGGEEAFG